MDARYFDTHFCLACRQTIEGLDSYVQHRKFGCSALTGNLVASEGGIDTGAAGETSSPTLLPERRSKVSFCCDFTTAGNPILPASVSDFVDARPWFDDVTGVMPVVATSAPSSSLSSSLAAALGPSSGLVEVTESVLRSSIVLYAENGSQTAVDDVDEGEFGEFFSSLQLRSKSSQADEKNVATADDYVVVDGATRDVASFFGADDAKLCDLKIEGGLESVIAGLPPSLSAGHEEEGGGGGGGETVVFDHSRAMRIASMFSNLDLESDSDDFDADDLLNFSDMDDEHDLFGGASSSSSSAKPTGGKLEVYRRSERLEGRSHHGKGGKTRREHAGPTPAQRSSASGGKGGKSIPTKWRPGERPASLDRYRQHSSRGKWQSPEGEDVDEEEEEEEDVEEADEEAERRDKEDVSGRGGGDGGGGSKSGGKDGRKTSEIKEKPTEGEEDATNDGEEKRKTMSLCETCDKSFLTERGLKTHTRTAKHARLSRLKTAQAQEVPEMSLAGGPPPRTVPAPDQPAPPAKTRLQCILCNKVFHSKYSFARHLMTPFHARRARYNERHRVVAETGLDAGVEALTRRLQPFQCRICAFDANGAERLLAHLATADHGERVRELSGPFVCVRCRRPCHDNDDMIAHVTSQEHVDAVKSSAQPCVLKERRCRIECPDCRLVIHSKSQLVRHRAVCGKPRRGAGGTSRPAAERPSSSRPLRCSGCPATFRSRFNLDVHFRRRHTEKRRLPFRCKTCDESFADGGALASHKQSKRHRDAVGAAFAERENVRERLRAVVAEEPTESGGRKKRAYRCKECDFVSDRYSEVIVHRTAEHVPPGCDVCGLAFANQTQRERHLLTAQHRQTEEEAGSLGREAPLTCADCPDSKFYTARSLKMHEMRHQVAQCRVTTDDDVERRCQRLIREAPAGDRIECPECGKKLTKLGILSHLRAHAGIFPFRCTFCAKQFSDVGALKRHLKVHLGIRAFRCKFCARDFLRHQALGAHVLREHREAAGIVPSHLCNICGRKFVQPNQLNSHLKFHDKTVRCPHAGCTLAFRYQSELRLHLQVHTKEARFLCDECGYAGKTRNQLSRHRRVHTGEKRYECTHCGYRAAHIANLRRHQRLHTAAKPYQCPHCNYACNTQENLRKHILKTKRHAGKPVYPCKRCDGFGCNSAVDFQRHLELVHGISRQHLPSIVAGLYKRDLDVKIQPLDFEIEIKSTDDS